MLEALKDASRGKHGPRSPSSQHTESQQQETNGEDKNTAAGVATALPPAIKRQRLGGGPCGGGPGGEADAETRRNAVRALVNVCEELGVGQRMRTAGTHGSGGVGVGDGVDSATDAGQQQQQRAENGQRNGKGYGGAGLGQDELKGAADVENGRDALTSSRWRPEALMLGDVEGVLAALLSAAADYSVDKRGDVGSWCRVEALGALERLARLAVRASTGLPLANRGEKVTGLEMQYVGECSERIGYVLDNTRNILLISWGCCMFVVCFFVAAP